jgi:hydrogenase maturation factor
MNNDSGWITISCHNCSSGDIYSVKRPNDAKISYPIDTSIISQSGDQVIIHKGTIVNIISESYAFVLIC